ncbi:MAG: hypothetical protein V4681_03225 [Patescibacteria group bacterium]
MKTILSILIALGLAYLLFVAANTYIYTQEQDEATQKAGVSIQWGF